MILLECAATGEVPLDRVREEIGLERLHAAAALKPGQLPPIEVQQLGQLSSTYSYLRRAVHAVLDAVELKGAASGGDALLAALKRMRSATGRFIDEPVELVPKTWRAWVLDDQGRVQRTRFELGLWFAARATRCAPGGCFARSGAATPTPPVSAARRALASRLRGARRHVRRTLDPDERLRELELEQHPETVRLRAELDRLVRHIDIPDVLAEVESWVGFTGYLTHAAGATPRTGDLQQHLHAALLASGLNLGPGRMAECCSLSYRGLLSNGVKTADKAAV